MIIAIASPLLLAVWAGYIGTDNAGVIALSLVRYSYSIMLAIIIAAAALWRWSAFLQQHIFPYLGGEWSGEIEFESEKGKETRAVTLQINHNVAAISLFLQSEESRSRTLVVHAERDKEIRYDRLYYVYRNERREGVENAGQAYRGTAILGIHPGSPLRLEGSYFTEGQRYGLMRLRQKSRHAFWAIWK